MTVPNVHALLLAAGRSSRTGAAHKLLATFDGIPLIRRSAITALASKANGVTVVVGYRAEAIVDALEGLSVSIVYNPLFDDGLSTSLIAGFANIPSQTDGILVMLADQPLLSPAHLDRLIDGFAIDGDGSLVVATDKGEWLNPVVISERFMDDISSITGDKGAKSLLMRHINLVRAIDIGEAARIDVDTSDAVIAAGGRLEN